MPLSGQSEVTPQATTKPTISKAMVRRNYQIKTPRPAACRPPDIKFEFSLFLHCSSHFPEAYGRPVLWDNGPSDNN
jgi:hypothetical protein